MPAENGFVPTPAPVADLAAMEVFGVDRPSGDSGAGRLLLPGLGTGSLYAAVRRYCTSGENWKVPNFEYPVPECVGVENDPERIEEFRDSQPTDAIQVHEGDFLLDPPQGPFDWVLANPPFSRYMNIPEDRRDTYRDRFETATGQFPLYVPFFEQALRLVKPDGWVTFILPVKALTNQDTERLRELLRRRCVGFIGLLPEQTFDEKVTTVIVSVKKQPHSPSSLWVENILAYGPQPLLERLGVPDEDMEEARADYMTLLKWYNRRVDRRYTPPQVAEEDPNQAAVSTQADIGRWS